MAQIVENINLTNENFTDRYAQLFFANAGISRLKLNAKDVTIKDTGETLKVIHFSGVTEDGTIVNFDMFPYYDAKDNDLEKFPKNIQDITFRVGYTTVFDPELKRTVVKTSNPYWLSINPDGECYKYSGEKRKRNYAHLSE